MSTGIQPGRARMNLSCMQQRHMLMRHNHRIGIHRRRKMLKVGGAECTIAREARANFYDHAYFVSNHAHFCTLEAAISIKK